MNEILRQNIIEELIKFLNREPSEKEIMNGVNDINIMNKIFNKKQKELEVRIDAQKVEIDKQKVEIEKLKTKK